MTSGGWTVRLSDTAEADYDDILRWTTQRFGARQAASYGEWLAAALVSLRRGPIISGVRPRDDVRVGLHTLHVGRRGRHFILFRIDGEAERAIDVLRILHDAMDLARHVPPED